LADANGRSSTPQGDLEAGSGCGNKMVETRAADNSFILINI